MVQAFVTSESHDQSRSFAIPANKVRKEDHPLDLRSEAFQGRNTSKRIAWYCWEGGTLTRAHELVVVEESGR